MHREGNKNIKYDRTLIERLNNIIPKIVDAFDPLEIIMYGSYARGDNDIYSDIDVLIIVEKISLRFQDRSIKALNIITDDGNDSEIPVNPLVYTSEEFREMLENKESFLIHALSESLLLWKKDKNIPLENQLEISDLESEFKKFIPE